MVLGWTERAFVFECFDLLYIMSFGRFGKSKKLELGTKWIGRLGA